MTSAIGRAHWGGSDNSVIQITAVSVKWRVWEAWFV